MLFAIEDTRLHDVQVLFTFEHNLHLGSCKTVPELQCQIHEALAREGIWGEAMMFEILVELLRPANYLGGTLGEAL